MQKALEAIVASLDKSIDFHSGNASDPHNVGNAVICALTEVKTAVLKAIEATKGAAQ